jgi:CubicO group peptidase (beta-lactamase class C family)
MRKYLITIILLTATAGAFGQIPIDSIKAIIRQEVANKRSKSIIVGIVNADGRQLAAAGIRSDKDPTPPDGNTIYEIGSITKVFTSLLLADMSLRKQVDLDAPISAFLPATVRTPVRNGKEISLLSLSTNRSGLPRNASNIDPASPDNPFADYTAKELYEFISGFELSRDVDARWQYSNIGYALLGHILALAGRNSLERLIDQVICRPLNMSSTRFATPSKLTNVAAGYSECGQPAAAWDFPLGGGGGLRSNLNDMLSFAEASLGFTRSDLYPAMELTHILRARKDGNDTYTTMGWTLANDDGKYILFKDGGTGGYRTFLGIDKKNRVGVVVLSNSNNPVTDIGWHILDPTHRIQPYSYPWALLDTLRASIRAKGADAAIGLYRQLKTSKNKAFIFNENQLNYLGNELRRNKKIKDAIKIYKLNIDEYPTSVLAYESLAETCKRNGDKETAIRYFEKAAESEPQNPHWAFILDKLRAG